MYFTLSILYAFLLINKNTHIVIARSIILYLILIAISTHNQSVLVLEILLVQNSITQLLIYLLVAAIAAIYSTDTRFEPEIYLIIMTNVLSIYCLIHSYDLILTFISLELFNLTLYLFISFKNNNLAATIKYFLLSVFSTIFLLLFVLYLYYAIGSTSYDALYIAKEYIDFGNFEMLLAIPLFFKLALAPLHALAPDLYDSLDSYKALYMILIPKLTVLYLINLFNIQSVLFGLLSISIGSIALSSQYRFKRFMAYSGIGHAGFLMLGIVDSNAYVYYYLVYSFHVMNIFLILYIYEKYLGLKVVYLLDFHHMLNLNPVLALSFVANILSLAGIPPFIGFFAKLYIFDGMITSLLLPILLVVIVMNTVSCVNYLKLIKHIIFRLGTYKHNTFIPYIYCIVISLSNVIMIF